jgi:ABC-type multidrug transport system ATPase subunit
MFATHKFFVGARQCRAPTHLSHSFFALGIIGYVPQAISADGSLTGYERKSLDFCIALYDIPSKQRRERIRDVLAFMGLEEASSSLVRTYSGGMIRFS